MKHKFIKIYGERNSGTNYLQDLITKNINIDLLPGIMPSRIINKQKYLLDNEFTQDLYDLFTYKKYLGWKHSLVRDPEVLKGLKTYKNNTVLFITITKNPYAWLLSLFRRPYHQDLKENISFEDFLIRPWESVYREHSPRLFKNPIELWNKKNRSYMTLGKKLLTINLTYEKLISDPESTVIKIAKKVSLVNELKAIKNIEYSTKNDLKRFSEYQDYYLDEKWRLELSVDAKNIINESLDDGVLNYFDYKRIV